MAMRDRVKVAKEVGFHPLIAPATTVVEGTHYKVLAYTDWADMFVPTVVEWANGETDRLTSREATLRNRDEAIAAVVSGDSQL